MGMNIVEKILARASDRATVSPGDLVTARVHAVVFIDTNFSHTVWREPKTTIDPDRIAVIFDHRVPAAHVEAATAQKVGREFVRKHGIRRFHDVGPLQGISHVIIAEHVYGPPGTVLVCSDSHTCSGGVLNCAARGVGLPDVIFAATKGTAWFKVGPTIRYDLVGSLKPGVYMKDVFLHLAGTYGDHVGQNIEYGGPALAGLSMDARRTLATMGTELSADFVVFEPDEIMLDYVRGRSTESFEEQYPDPDARYLERRTIDLSAIPPLIAFPDAVIHNSHGITEAAEVRVDQAFIGSCAAGNLEDLEIAAKVLKGRTVSPNVRLVITPGSQAIYLEASKRGIVTSLVEAGAVVTNATCGACGGGSLGLLAPNETCITASPRNFKGRMGHPSAKIYMGSPATVAASAINGVISDPTPFLED